MQDFLTNKVEVIIQYIENDFRLRKELSENSIALQDIYIEARQLFGFKGIALNSQLHNFLGSN